MNKIDKITIHNNGVWSTKFSNGSLSISPNTFFVDVKEQKLEMIVLKINELIDKIIK